MTRLRGGTAGILSAIDAGTLDPLSPFLPEERDLPAMNAADRRALLRREARRLKRIANRLPF